VPETRDRGVWQIVFVLSGAPALYILIFLTSMVELETFTRFAFLGGMATEYLFLGVVLGFLRRGGGSLTSLEASKEGLKRKVLLGVLLGILLMFTFTIIDAVISNYLPTFPGLREPRPRWAVLIFGLGLFTAFGPIEEIVWRGYCITELMRVSESVWVAVLASSASFGFMHWWGGPSQIFVAGVMGILYSIIYLHWRSLIVNITAHITSELPVVIFMSMVSFG